eukprot:1520222-Rhodomonas_salina.2
MYTHIARLREGRRRTTNDDSTFIGATEAAMYMNDKAFGGSDEVQGHPVRSRLDAPPRIVTCTLPHPSSTAQSASVKQKPHPPGKPVEGHPSTAVERRLAP